MLMQLLEPRVGCVGRAGAIKALMTPERIRGQAAGKRETPY